MDLLARILLANPAQCAIEPDVRRAAHPGEDTTMADVWHQIPGFLRSPNISGDWRLYEIENRAADPEHSIEAAMARIAPWRDKVLVDVGAGTGYHIERFHQDAAHVIAIEPDPTLRLELMQRIASRQLARTSVIGASAAALPLCENAADIAHARFAYFFGPGSEPGLAELERVLKPGGTIFIVDNDLRSGTFARWILEAYGRQHHDPDEIECFWHEHGFTIERLESCWRFENRDDLERVVHLEFPDEHASRFVAGHEGLTIDYNLLLIHKTLPD
jgi:SAM-dependent methyltransferase